MHFKITVLLWSVFVLSIAQVRAQDQPEREKAPTPAIAPDARNMIQAASDLRKASEALVQITSLLEKMIPIVAQAAVDASHELATMSNNFDPFGYKTSYRVIHEQNKIILEQTRLSASCSSRRFCGCGWS